MTDAILISVCIANFNGMEVIDDCLRSVLQQQCAAEVEILVHDDASVDGSVAHVRDLYPTVKLLASPENVGFCVANNRMVAEATGKYLLLLNNDAALYPDALQTLLVEASRLDRRAILTLPQYDAGSGELLDMGCLVDPFLNPVPNRDGGRCDVAMVMGACLWMPKDLWQELGGFPEWFGSIGEDLHLCCRARLAGYLVRAVTTSGYLHHVGRSFGGGKARHGRLSTTRRRRALSERNKTFVMIVCQPLVLLAALLPLHLALIHLEGFLLLAIQRDAALWREVYAPLLPRLWTHREKLLRERQLAQSVRKISLHAWLQPFRWWPRKLQMFFRHGLPKVE